MFHGSGITYAFHTCEEIGFDSLEPIVSTAMAMQRLFNTQLVIAFLEISGVVREPHGAAIRVCLRLLPRQAIFPTQRLMWRLIVALHRRPRLIAIHRTSYKICMDGQLEPTLT
jgi:hypothetical protein